MKKADKYIFINGRIFTSNPEQPYANAMVVSNGIIEWIGDKDDLEMKDGICIDLHDRRVLPGFIDAHMHPTFLANAESQIACVQPNVNSIEELQEKIREKRKLIEDDEWIEGWGYDEGKLTEGRAPTRWDLDKAAADVPIVITRTCCHISAVNSLALKMAGINKNTPNPPGGQIDRDLDGEPTGILRENARDLVLSIMPKQTLENSAIALAQLSPKLLAHGITTVAEALAMTEPEYFDVYCKAHGYGLKQRTILYYLWDELKKHGRLDMDKTNSEKPVYVGGIKILGDGSVSGKTAWVDAPYLSDDECYGLPTTSREELLEAAEFAKVHNLQMVIHAMGQQTINLVIDTLYNEKGWLKNAPSIRIEHAAMPTEQALRRASESGIAFVTQPIFLYAEIETYINNLGAERTKKTYPIQDMLREGIKVAFSSDAPATAWADPANPFVGIKSAVTRKAYDGTDTGQEHRVDVATAITFYTREAQQVSGIPQVGQLTPGYKADFIVLNQDILEISSEKIDETYVEETYMDGQLVYKR